MPLPCELKHPHRQSTRHTHTRSALRCARAVVAPAHTRFALHPHAHTSDSARTEFAYTQYSRNSRHLTPTLAGAPHTEHTRATSCPCHLQTQRWAPRDLGQGAPAPQQHPLPVQISYMFGAAHSHEYIVNGLPSRMLSPGRRGAHHSEVSETVWQLDAYAQ